VTERAVPDPETAEAPPRAGRLVALRSRDFRLLLAGQVVSLTGTQMQHVAVVWQLYLLTGSPLALGMLGLFRVTPIVLLRPGRAASSPTRSTGAS